MNDFDTPSITPPPPPISNPFDSTGGSSRSIREKIVLEQGEIRSANYLPGSQGWRISADTAEFNFTISTGAIDIGGADATSFHVDTSGNMWLGASTFAAAPFQVSAAGALTVTGATITGSVLQTGTSGENVNITAAYISLRNGASETGYLRGYQTTDRYGDALNASELSVNDVKSVRFHHPGMIALNGGGGGTIDAAWLWGTTDFSATDRGIALIAPTVYITGATDDSVAATIYTHGNITTATNKGYDIGTAVTAFDDVYADDFQNVADFLFLDSKNDLAELHKIKGSGMIDPRTGIEIIDDDTVPDWLLTKDKITGEVARSEDGKPYIAVKTMLSLLMGAVRQLDNKVTNL